MTIAFAHIMADVDYVSENYARKAPNSYIVAREPKTIVLCGGTLQFRGANLLIGGPEEELKTLCEEYGGHLVKELSATLVYRSVVGRWGKVHTTQHDTEMKNPEDTLTSVKKVTENPWNWLKENKPDTYKEHLRKKGIFRKKLVLDFSEYGSNFVAELYDGLHVFTVYRK